LPALPSSFYLIFLSVFDILQDMKSFFASVIIIGFLGVSIFGLFAMSHGDSHNSKCFAAVSSAADCSVFSSILEFIEFHLGAIKKFSTAVFAGATELPLLLFVFAYAVFAFSSPQAVFHIVSRREKMGSSRIAGELSGRKFRHWLSLLEESPGICQARARRP